MNAKRSHKRKPGQALRPPNPNALQVFGNLLREVLGLDPLYADGERSKSEDTYRSQLSAQSSMQS